MRRNRVPQFIADVARSRGVDGILYNSTRPSPFFAGDCLVLFPPLPNRVLIDSVTCELSGPHEVDINFIDQIWRLDVVAGANVTTNLGVSS